MLDFPRPTVLWYGSTEAIPAEGRKHTITKMSISAARESARSSELALVDHNPGELYRNATDVAGVCKDIVVKSSVTIGKRRYVLVEGWMAIATAHGCMASCKLVEKVEDGFRAVAEIRRMRDGAVLCEAEGFVGKDETTWFGGPAEVWSKFKNAYVTVTKPKREEYAIRAMAQTRAVSRACRTAFAHVVVMMNENLSTTPAEEVGEPEPMFEEQDPGQKKETTEKKADTTTPPAEDGKKTEQEPPPGKPAEEKKGAAAVADDLDEWREGKWRLAEIHFGKNKGTTLGKLADSQLRWYVIDWQPRPYGGAKELSADDKRLRAACDVACQEEGIKFDPKRDGAR